MKHDFPEKPLIFEIGRITPLNIFQEIFFYQKDIKKIQVFFAILGMIWGQNLCNMFALTVWEEMYIL